MPADRFIHPKLGHSEKVSHLKDFDFRVWMQYILSADDFGVMRASAVTLQADNDALACRSGKVVQAAIDRLEKVGLLRSFKHQGRKFVYQSDWQEWQKVEYPRTTHEPKPDAEALPNCTLATQRLFDKHPGGGGKKRPELSPRVPQEFSESSPPTRAGVPAKRLTANGRRLEANGSEGGAGETAHVDEWARELVNLYPPAGRCTAALAEGPLFKALTEDSPGQSLWEAWASLLERLEGHKRSHRWRVKEMIPRLDRYLRDGGHLQELPEHPVSTLVNERTERTLTSAAAFINGGGDGQ